MKYLPLLWAGVWRKPGRTVLLGLQILCAFVLFGLLQGLNSSVKKFIADAHRDRLYVNIKLEGADPLPISAAERIRAIPGVKVVNERILFGGAYQQPNQFVPIMATNPDRFFAVLDEFRPTEGAIAALKSTRSGAIVGRQLAQQFGWKVGDRFVLQSPVPRQDGTRNWAFDVVGIFDIPIRPQDARLIVVNYEYVNEARLMGRDTADIIAVRINDPEQAAVIGLAIDNVFANSGHETRTQSEADVLTAQIQNVADLDYIVTGIIVSVFFALLFATGALMMQSMRERVPELGILKTLGFTDSGIMKLILVESVVLCVCAASLGLLIASLLQPYARKQISIATMPAGVLVAGLGFALIVAILGGSIPAWRGLRLQIVDALAVR